MKGEAGTESRKEKNDEKDADQLEKSNAASSERFSSFVDSMNRASSTNDNTPKTKEPSELVFSTNDLYSDKNKQNSPNREDKQSEHLLSDNHNKQSDNHNEQSDNHNPQISDHTADNRASETDQQKPKEQPDREIEKKEREDVIEKVIKEMNDHYVFPEVAKKTEEFLRQQLANGRYDTSSSKEFAKRLTDDLREVTEDKHLNVLYSNDEIKDRKPPTEEDVAEARKKMEADEYAIHYDVLPGNTGYLKIDTFLPLEDCKKRIDEVMSKLANCDALIIDLTKNQGGDPKTVAYLMSYLAEKNIHLNDIVHKDGHVDSTYTTDVDGNKFGPDKPVYVLTSKTTFSAAEEFAYDAQALKRATVIGETTGGGANPGEIVKVNPHFQVFVPFAYAKNPITGGNWEHEGVHPDPGKEVHDPKEAKDLAWALAQIEIAKRREKK